MKQYRIPRYEIMNFINDDPAFDFINDDPAFGCPMLKQLVVDRLVKNGFDKDKPITEHYDPECDFMIYEQED